MTMASLVALGAPELTCPGHFYRVRRGLEGNVTLQIRREGRWFSRLVTQSAVSAHRDQETWEWLDKPISYEEALVGAAKAAHKMAALRMEQDRWMGDHR